MCATASDCSQKSNLIETWPTLHTWSCTGFTTKKKRERSFCIQSPEQLKVKTEWSSRNTFWYHGVSVAYFDASFCAAKLSCFSLESSAIFLKFRNTLLNENAVLESFKKLIQKDTKRLCPFAVSCNQKVSNILRVRMFNVWCLDECSRAQCLHTTWCSDPLRVFLTVCPISCWRNDAQWIQWSLALSIWLPNVWPVAFYIFYSMFAWWTVTTITQTACQRKHSKNWGEVTQFSKQCCPMVRKLLICSTVAMLHAAPHRKPSWICKILSNLSNIPMLFLRDHRAKPRPGR